MIRMDLTPEDASLLHELLSIYLADFRREVARTEKSELRHSLRHRQDFLEEFLHRLEAASESPLLEPSIPALR